MIDYIVDQAKKYNLKLNICVNPSGYISYSMTHGPKTLLIKEVDNSYTTYMVSSFNSIYSHNTFVKDKNMFAAIDNRIKQLFEDEKVNG